MKYGSSKSLTRKVLDIQDTGKPSGMVATGINIDSQVGRNSHKIFSSRTAPEP